MYKSSARKRLEKYRAEKQADFFGYDAKRGQCRHIDNIEEIPFIKRCTHRALWDGTEKCKEHSPEFNRLKDVLGIS